MKKKIVTVLMTAAIGSSMLAGQTVMAAETTTETAAETKTDENGFAHITQRNKFTVGETVEIMKPDGRNIEAVVKAIYDEDGNSVESAPHPQQKLAVDLGTEIEQYDLLRRSEE